MAAQAIPGSADRGALFEPARDRSHLRDQMGGDGHRWAGHLALADRSAVGA
jgi:hypothetical protein